MMEGRGCRWELIDSHHLPIKHPPWVLATSVERSRSPIGSPNSPESIGDSELKFAINSWAGVANQPPRPLHRGRQCPPWISATSVEGSGSPISGPNP
ncbi:hypothetical protein CRG98_007738 [Punica granatum]|uniref:Uncharacterized protein n=1 Tax=Punica granatum TaxID=22663 RepID=A0A2I0KTU3_PUNGR|nr:hypothetical protein CRG98_007738 [Punica granatum]